MQANVLREGHYFQDLECMVLEYADDKIYLKLKDVRQTTCVLHQIRNIEYMNSLKWSDKG